MLYTLMLVAVKVHIDILYIYLHVGQTCCRWNQDRRHVVWNMCLHGNFLHRWTMSSLHMIHTVLAACSSSTVASGYLEGEHSVLQCAYNYP